MSAIALTASAAVPDSRAAEDCGPPAGLPPTVNCLAPAMGESFVDADGITYLESDLTIEVEAAATAEFVSSGFSFGSYGDLVIVNRGTIAQTATSGAFARAGLHAASTGSITITSSGDISTQTADVHGIYGHGYGLTSVTTTGGATITTAANYASGIFTIGASGDIEIESGAAISTAGDNAYGIRAATAAGAITITTLLGSSIATLGDDASGIYALARGVATVNNAGSIETEGRSAIGIEVTSAAPDQVLTVTSSGAIRTGGYRSAGIEAEAYSIGDSYSSDVEITVSANITVEESQGDGIRGYSEDRGVTITVASGVTVATNTLDSYGADAAGDAINAFGPTSVTVLSYGSLRTYGYGGRGIYAYSTDGTVDVTTDGQIATTGDEASGIHAEGQQAITITGAAAIATLGGNAHGIFARSGYQPAGASIEITQGAAIGTAGAGANGIDAAVQSYSLLTIATLAAGDLTLTGASIGIRGRSDYGAIAAAIAGDVTAALGAGIDLESYAGLVELNLSGSVTAGGGDGVVMITSGDVDFASTAAGSVLRSGTADSAVFLSGALVEVDNAGRIDGGAVGLRIVASDGTTLVNSGFIGAGLDLAIDGGAAVGLDLIENSGEVRGFIALGDQATRFENQMGGLLLLQDRADLAALADFGGGDDSFVNAAGATVRLAALAGGPESASLQGLESFEHLGRITLADIEAGAALAEAGDSVVISGDFVTQGGTLALDVVLGDSSSAADLLRIGGGVSDGGGGPTLIEVVNAGGLGAATVGNGILVVEIGGSSAAGAFALSGGPIDVNGFVYDLAQQADGNWYLVSEAADDPPPPADDPGNPVVDYRALQSAALLLARRNQDALHERMGELRYFFAGRPELAALGGTDALAVRSGVGDQRLQGLWLRALGGDETWDQSVGRGFDLTTAGLQAGYDIGFQAVLADDDRLLLGAFATLASASGELADSDAAFSIESRGLGLYATWLQGEGLYLDGVASLELLDLEQSTPALAAQLDTSGLAVAGSLELGYHLGLGDGFFLEPQLQLAYSQVFVEDATDSAGSTAAFGAARSLQGRLGARAGATVAVGTTGRLTPYLDVGLLQEFLGESEVATAGLAQRNDLAGSALEVGFGVAGASLASNLSLHLDADWVRGDETQGFRVTAGLRVTW